MFMRLSVMCTLYSLRERFFFFQIHSLSYDHLEHTVKHGLRFTEAFANLFIFFSFFFWGNEQ